MLLKPIPPDPEPSDEEIAPYLKEDDGDFAEMLARMRWEANKKADDNNFFIVRFATEVNDYDSYLESNLWRRIRRKIIKSSGGQCAACTSKASQVHHRDYRPRVLAGEDLDSLVPLCKSCHDKVHQDGKRRRDTWEEIESTLAKLVEAKKRNQMPS